MWTLLASGLSAFLVSASEPIRRQRPAASPSAASFYVPSIPGLTGDPNNPLHIYAGNILSDASAKPEPSTDVNAHIYFVLTKARRTADRERLIIWFNGGPGCSSFDGLMMEIGPWRMDGKDSLKQVPGGWEEYANVLYLDQPPGTGYSYTSTNKYLHELDEVAGNVVEFLKNWYDVFPEFKEMDTYLAGESFAGQYMPYIADAILGTTQISTPLKGIAIGNGWIDPISQYPAYIEFAVQENLLKTGTKEYDKAVTALDKCMITLNTTEPTPHIGLCEFVMGATVQHLQQTVNGKEICLNVYDIRLVDDFPACGMNWPPDLTYITPYLERDDVKTVLHATEHAEAWTECRATVSSNLDMKKSPPSIGLLPKLLENIPVLLFSGDQDFICNHVGTERLIEALEWNGDKGFGPNTKAAPWKFNGTDAGEWTSERNMTYAKIYGASHMVGFDVPHVAHDMMLRFMNVDFTSILTGSAMLPSSVGDNVKPDLTKVPSSGGKDAAEGVEETASDETPLEALYNLGSAIVVLLLIALAMGLFFYIRKRWRSGKSKGVVALARDEEEAIPLSQNVGGENDGRYSPIGGRGGKLDKGKAKAKDSPLPELRREPIFDVGDSDDEEDKRR